MSDILATTNSDLVNRNMFQTHGLKIDISLYEIDLTDLGHSMLIKYEYIFA